MTGELRVLVLQWAKPGRVSALAALEDELVQIALRYADEVTREGAARLRDYTDGPPPDEVHVMTFPDEGAFDAFIADPDRRAAGAQGGDALERTLIYRLTPMDR